MLQPSLDAGSAQFARIRSFLMILFLINELVKSNTAVIRSS
jgi:hypothetical protein